MSIMNSFVNDIFERIAAEASPPAHYNKRSPITSREIRPLCVSCCLVSSPSPPCPRAQRLSPKYNQQQVNNFCGASKQTALFRATQLSYERIVVIVTRT
ncbi:hypothetical protein DPMN_020254 [Dreissena polymorpha]|uniref:Histone H2A/H2B/H3 domain-containing protein n=1 Tax=Dreissena polymorpha TaxID=45954 RepID=A0A9D4NKS6_DREPO|nr:hypothetical protein DPMN_020254 [Dreissena polymorpha]